MSTIINAPVQGESANNMGMLLGVVLLVAVVFLFLYFGLPMLRNASKLVPQAPQIQVPEQIDINVQSGQ